MKDKDTNILTTKKFFLEIQNINKVLKILNESTKTFLYHPRECRQWGQVNGFHLSSKEKRNYEVIDEDKHMS